MKNKNILFILFLLCCLILHACARINSVRPFDESQAKEIIKQWYKPNGLGK